MEVRSLVVISLIFSVRFSYLYLAVRLCIGYAFETWEDVDVIMKAYGKQQGFGVIRKRLERHPDGSVKHRAFGCKFGSQYEPKKKLPFSTITILNQNVKDAVGMPMSTAPKTHAK